MKLTIAHVLSNYMEEIPSLSLQNKSVVLCMILDWHVRVDICQVWCCWTSLAGCSLHSPVHIKYWAGHANRNADGVHSDLKPLLMRMKPSSKRGRELMTWRDHWRQNGLWSVLSLVSASSFDIQRWYPPLTQNIWANLLNLLKSVHQS